MAGELGVVLDVAVVGGGVVVVVLGVVLVLATAPENTIPQTLLCWCGELITDLR